MKDAVGNAGIAKPATCHTFRYSFAAPLSEVEQDIRIVQELLARQDERTHVLTRGAKGVRSLADTLG